MCKWAWPRMILLKAKVCMHHSPAMVCSRFLTSAGKTGISVKEEGPQLGEESRKMEQSQLYLPTQCYIQIGIGHQM